MAGVMGDEEESPMTVGIESIDLPYYATYSKQPTGGRVSLIYIVSYQYYPSSSLSVQSVSLPYFFPGHSSSRTSNSVHPFAPLG